MIVLCLSFGKSETIITVSRSSHISTKSWSNDMIEEESRVGGDFIFPGNDIRTLTMREEPYQQRPRIVVHERYHSSRLWKPSSMVKEIDERSKNMMPTLNQIQKMRLA